MVFPEILHTERDELALLSTNLFPSLMIWRCLWTRQSKITSILFSIRTIWAPINGTKVNHGARTSKYFALLLSSIVTRSGIKSLFTFACPPVHKVTWCDVTLEMISTGSNNDRVAIFKARIFRSLWWVQIAIFVTWSKSYQRIEITAWIKLT